MSYAQIAGFAMRSRPLFEAMAVGVDARANCARDIEAGTAHESILALRAEWFERWTERLETWSRDFLPSGSGFDSGTKIDLDASTGGKLIFRTAFHHMNPNGFYDGWTEHAVTVRPSFSGGFNLAIGGRDRNGIKDYIAESFDAALREHIDSDGSRVPDREPGAFHCARVAGGWQTCESQTGLLFGPVHRALDQLWEWQRANMVPAAPALID